MISMYKKESTNTSSWMGVETFGWLHANATLLQQPSGEGSLPRGASCSRTPCPPLRQHDINEGHELRDLGKQWIFSLILSLLIHSLFSFMPMLSHKFMINAIAGLRHARPHCQYEAIWSHATKPRSNGMTINGSPHSCTAAKAHGDRRSSRS